MYTIFLVEQKIEFEPRAKFENRSLLCQLQLSKKVEDKKGIQMLSFLAVKKQLTRL